MAELLLELFCEEIPARMQRDAAEALRKNIADKFTAASLSYEVMDAYVTPRRLILHVVGLPERTPDIIEERRGPKVDAPDAAIAGFLKSTGLAREQLTQRADGKATFFYAEVHKAGRASVEAIADIIPAVVRGFAWPKSMRWGERSSGMDSLRWVRPLQSILCLLDGETVPFEIDGLRSGNTTRGHRFMSNSLFPVSSFEDYRTKLRLGRVIIDSQERARVIETAAKKLASDAGLELVDDAGLLIENAGLTEWPVPLLGSFDADFLSVPPEVIQLTMRTNQKYFALRDASTGTLSNHFICTANIEASDGGKLIMEGNQKVLAARLSDARFFWEQDRKKPLEAFLPKLSDIVFHEKLGTVADKVERVAKLARELAPACGADPDLAERAARLCKADLVTGMVGEFPELQGVMGSYYAATAPIVTPAKAGVHSAGQTTDMGTATTVDPGLRRDDDDSIGTEHPDVARAIREHYAPQGPSDACPTAPVSVAVALADKIDTLVGFFSVGEVPTGSKDPFALRRAALSSIRLIIENRLRVSKFHLFGTALIPYIVNASKLPISEIETVFQVLSRFIGSREAYSILDLVKRQHLDGISSIEMHISSLEKIANSVRDLSSFFNDRIRAQERDSGVPSQFMESVLSVAEGDDLVLLLSHIKALQTFLGTDDGKQLLSGYKRAANILKIEEKKDKYSYEGAVDASKLVLPEETALHAALGVAQSSAVSAVQAEAFETAMTALAQLRLPIDAFFEKVIVNAEDIAIRTNRLNLLAAIRAAVHTVADFSKIEG